MRGDPVRTSFLVAGGWARNHLVTEDDTNLFVPGIPTHGLEPGLLGALGLRDRDVSLDPAHEEEHPRYDEGPEDQDRGEEQLIASHGY